MGPFRNILLCVVFQIFTGSHLSDCQSNRASARSPDLTPPDYFLWGYLKGRVYQIKPRTIDALRANITEEIQAVTADVLARTVQNMARRVQSCMDANGGHFQHTL
jgi:hypothetical protein